jgi:WXG100 family type VII secretion target
MKGNKMADKTEVNYEQLQAIGKKFKSEGDAINQLLSQTKGRVDGLHGTGWIGRGSDQFFREMNEKLLPSLANLVQALNAAGEAADAVMKIYRSAEEQCQGFFKSIGD